MLQVYDRVLTSYNVWTLLALTIIFSFVLVVNALLDRIKLSIAQIAAEDIETNLSNNIYKKYHQEKISEKPIIQALNDIQIVKQFFPTFYIYFIDLPWIPIFLFIGFLFNFWLGIFSCFCVIILITLNFFNLKLSSAQSNKLHEKKEEKMKRIDETSRFFEIIQTFNIGTHLFKEWELLSDKTRNEERKYTHLTGHFNGVSKFLRLYFQSIVLALGAILAINNQISPGMLIAGAIILGRALSPLDHLIKLRTFKNQYEKACQLLFKILNSEGKKETKKKIVIDNLEPTFKFRNVSLNKRGFEKQKIINNLSVDLKPFRTLIILGPSGAGKTSLIKLLIGLWKPDEGDITIDGYKIQGIENYHNFISYIPQEIQLLGGTVADNISAFDKAATDIDIIKAAKLAGAHEFIQNLNGGYKYNLGHNGSGLSGGERQKITLARAFYKESPIYIFDEPTSNQDDISLKRFIETVIDLKKQNKTIIISSHSKELIPLADDIMVLVGGKLSAYDSRDAILSKILVKQPK